MTGYTVNTGSTEKFASGWDNIFTKKTERTKKSTPTKAAKKTAAKKKGKKKS